MLHDKRGKTFEQDQLQFCLVMGRLCIAIFLSLGLALVANATKNQEKESKDSWLSSWRDWSYSFVSSAFRPVTALLANLLSNRNQQPEFSSGVKNVSAEVGQDAHLICYIKNDENIHVKINLRNLFCILI